MDRSRRFSESSFGAAALHHFDAESKHTNELLLLSLMPCRISVCCARFFLDAGLFSYSDREEEEHDDDTVVVFIEERISGMYE